MDEQLGGAASAGAIRASIDFDAAGLERAVNKAMTKATAIIGSKVDRASEEMQEKVEGGFRGLGHRIVGFLGLEDITYAINRSARFIINIGRQTEQSLNQFQAVSGATKAQMKSISDLAIQLGNDITLPGTSAADAATAMTELAKAGFTVEQSMAAAKGTLQLAAAAQTDAGTAAEIASEQINAFNLKASDAGKVADLLANAANVSAADMTGMADSLKQVSAVANAAGLSIEDTTGAIALMANNSIQGSDAGTSLKTMLVSLAAPSTKAQKIMQQYGIDVYDASGHLKDLSGIVGSVSHGLKGATDQQKQYALATIFGTDAIRAINVLMHEGSKGLDKMGKSLDKAGAAQKLATANTKGLTGAIAALQGNAESLAIEFYQKVSPALDQFIRGRLEDLPGFLAEVETYLGEVTDTLEPAATLIREFIQAASPGALLAFKGGLAALLGVLEATSSVLSPLASLVENNETAFRALVGPLVAATVAYKVFSTVVGKAQDSWRTGSLNTARVRVNGLRTSLRSATTVASGFRTAASGVMDSLGGGWGIALGAAAAAVGIFASKHAEAQQHVQELTDSLNDQTGAITKNTRELVANALEKSGAFDAAKRLGIALDDVTEAALHEGDARERVNNVIRESIDGTAEYAANLSRAGTASARMSGDATKLNAAINGQNGAVNEAVDRHRDLSEAMGSSGKSSGHFARQITEVDRNTSRADVAVNRFSRSSRDSAGALNEQADAADRTKRAIKGLRDEAIKGVSAQIDFQESADNLRKTIKDLTPEEVKSGHALDAHFKSGRDVLRNMIDLANASGKVKGGMEKAKDQIFNTARELGYTKGEAQDLVEKFFDLNDAMGQIPNRKTITVDAKGTDKAISDVRLLKYEVDQLHDKTIMLRTTGGHVPGQATGGAVYGPGTGTSDSILRRLSDGEHVFTAAEVQDAGGQANVYAIRAALRRGGLPALADLAGGHGGALVDKLTVAVGDKRDLPEALDETMFHLRRIGRGGRYND